MFLSLSHQVLKKGGVQIQISEVFQRGAIKDSGCVGGLIGGNTCRADHPLHLPTSYSPLCRLLHPHPHYLTNNPTQDSSHRIFSGRVITIESSANCIFHLTLLFPRFILRKPNSLLLRKAFLFLEF